MLRVNKLPNKRQAGMTFWGTLIVLAALVLLGTFGIKAVPAYVEFGAVKRAVKKLGTEDLSTKTAQEIRTAFDRNASASYINSVKGSDLVIESGTITVEYQKVIPLFYNMSILLDFNASSAK
jgi:hypothetical protein